MTTDLAPTRPQDAPLAARRFRKERGRFFAAVGLATLLAGGAAVWAAQRPASDAAENEAPAAPPAPAVTVSPAQERLIAQREERLGRIAAIETVDLRPEVSGKIVAVGFASGERVTAGQILFEIDATSYRAAVEQAAAEVARAEARAETAGREAERAVALFDKRVISSEEAELRSSLAAEAKSDLLAAQAALKSAQIDLNRTFVRSPINGRASRAFVTKGNLVSGAPASATLLTTIVSTGAAHVYVDLDEAAALRFRRARDQGAIAVDENGRVPVELRLDQEATYSHKGYVESLDNQIDPATGSLTLRLHFDDPQDRLLPGSFVRARIPVSREEPRLVVSERAIGTDQSQKFVLAVLADNTVAYRAVSIGPAIGGERIVTAGLKAGERVIVNGTQRVRPGMVVTPQAASESASGPLAAR